MACTAASRIANHPSPFAEAAAVAAAGDGEAVGVADRPRRPALDWFVTSRVCAEFESNVPGYAKSRCIKAVDIPRINTTVITESDHGGQQLPRRLALPPPPPPPAFDAGGWDLPPLPLPPLLLPPSPPLLMVRPPPAAVGLPLPFTAAAPEAVRLVAESEPLAVGFGAVEAVPAVLSPPQALAVAPAAAEGSNGSERLGLGFRFAPRSDGCAETVPLIVCTVEVGVGGSVGF